MAKDLDSTLRLLHAGGTTATAEMERCLDRAHAPECQHVFTPLLAGQAAREAANPGQAHRPLAGLAVSVKELFDMQGMTTRAGSTVLAEAPPAACDAAAVQRLRGAGGAVIGRTQMVEFAFSGVGTNPHHGTPAAFDGRFGALPGPARVPGGSSSGAAVSVATGAAFIGLGSDTGGSIRIPAALCGIVGFKNTARLVPTSGAVPLSTTLDTACAMTRSVPDAVLAHEILAARRVTRSQAPLSAWRLAVPGGVFLEGLEPPVRSAFERSVEQLRRAGARIVEIELPEVAQLSGLQATGGFAAAESYAWHRQHLAQSGPAYDPRVRGRIERGARMSAADYIDLLHARTAWIAQIEAAIAGFDALLSPTVPILAPLLASVAPADGTDPQQDAARDAEFGRVNALLLRNPSIVNMLDGCALSLPCHQAGELPVGLMLWHAAMHDDAVLNVGLRVEEQLQES
ncbi:MAG: amidase [Simplicispira suum]|uniref:amidase n=1 Tax=Simplicispira suum TaxID=2109915 RepID=UPI001C6C61CF|nr:amidase [Simplicispira suum]MBW7833878.1 amidase [Simplicispira suum]